MLHILRYEDFSCNFCNLDTVLTDRVCCFWRYCLAWFCVRQQPAVCTDWFVGLLDYSVTPYRLHLTQLTFLITWQWLVLGLKRLTGHTGTSE